MLQISYTFMVIFISVLWLFARAIVWAKNKQISWKRELQLLLVYICLLVVTRFTFCPFGKVDGKIQPLVLSGPVSCQWNILHQSMFFLFKDIK